jgi:threonine dehydrogenase-like Zn-dependent dehydrogenase
MIQKIKPACLITHIYPFRRAAEAYKLLDIHPEKTIQVLFQYEEVEHV